jgi:uncharacterized Zn-finger protein
MAPDLIKLLESKCDMTAADEVYYLDNREVLITPQLYVACDGGVGPLGHPRVFMTLEHGGEVTCLYCSRLYVHASSPRAESIRREATPPAA